MSDPLIRALANLVRSAAERRPLLVRLAGLLATARDARAARTVRMEDLTGPQQELVRALIEADKAGKRPVSDAP